MGKSRPRRSYSVAANQCESGEQLMFIPKVFQDKVSD